MLLIDMTQEMCDIAVLENGGTLESAPDCYKNLKMCNQAVDDCAHPLKLVPNCHKTQKMCNKAVNNHPSTTQFVSE